MKREQTNAESKDLPPIQIDDIGEPGAIEVVERITMDAADLEAFMNEQVEVYIHESNDENAGQFEYSGVEGRVQILMRGRSQKIKRKYVERLVRARKTTFTQNLDLKDETMNTLRPHSAPMIPFSVQNDTPKGKAWFDRLMQEPA